MGKKAVVAVVITAAVLAAGGYAVWESKSYYPPLPVESLSKRDAVEAGHGAGDELVRLAGGEDGFAWYITGAAGGGAADRLRQHMERDGWTFEGQEGAGYFFARGDEQRIVTSQMWSRHYVLFKEPIEPPKSITGSGLAQTVDDGAKYAATAAAVADNARLQERLSTAIQENLELESYVKRLVSDYEQLYFDICTSVSHDRCAPELKYFDPRQLNEGDPLFGLNVASVSIGEHDYGSFLVRLEGEAVIRGKYTVVEDDYLGKHVRFETQTIAGHRYTLQLVLAGEEGGREDVLSLFPQAEGTASVTVSAIVFGRAPHKPLYNTAVVRAEQTR